MWGAMQASAGFAFRGGSPYRAKNAKPAMTSMAVTARICASAPDISFLVDVALRAASFGIFPPILVRLKALSQSVGSTSCPRTTHRHAQARIIPVRHDVRLISISRFTRNTPMRVFAANESPLSEDRRSQVRTAMRREFVAVDNGFRAFDFILK
jgi:hypothetical protein